MKRERERDLKKAERGKEREEERKRERGREREREREEKEGGEKERADMRDIHVGLGSITHVWKKNGIFGKF